MDSVLERILDDARWAPSGDNTQPWRFQIVGPDHVVVHGHDTREHCVYDLRGEASQLSLGALLESMSIAASIHGWVAAVHRRAQAPDHLPTFDVRFERAVVQADPLADFLRRRCVQRRPLRTRSLTDLERASLEASVSPAYRVVWIEGFAGRWTCARLMFSNAYLRLTMPEAYEVHRSVIEWNARESVDRVPDGALGVDRLSLKMMRAAMLSWERVHFANRFLAGTWLPRLQMDLLPAMACAAHAVIVGRSPPQGIDDFVAVGRAVQRFWLTATSLGLWQQPEMTPLIFARYVRQGLRFTRAERIHDLAPRIAAGLSALLGDDADKAVWMGRLGEGPTPQARSMRQPLAQLMVDAPPTGQNR